MNTYSYKKGKEYMQLLSEDKIIDVSELFKIFGDSTRVKIINALIDEELCVNDIAERINVSQSAVSHQLRILKGSKLVKYRKDGQTVYYSIADDHVEKIFKIGCEHVDEI